MWNKLQQKPLTAASSAWQVLLFQLLLRVDCNLFTSLSSGSFQLHYSMLVRLQLFIDISMAQLLCMIERPPTIVLRRKPLFLFLNNEQTQRSTQIRRELLKNRDWGFDSLEVCSIFHCQRYYLRWNKETRSFLGFFARFVIYESSGFSFYFSAIPFFFFHNFLPANPPSITHSHRWNHVAPAELFIKFHLLRFFASKQD